MTDKTSTAPDTMVYVPGLWRCAKCEFELIQSNLHPNGAVTARDQPGDKCPNCNSPLWRVTYKDAYATVCQRFETYLLTKADSAPTPDVVGGDVVPPEWLSEQVGGEFDDMTSGQGYRRGWNDCRQAMLAAAPSAGRMGVDK
ncbi:MAG: hypothetical protein GAK28_02934 [Luteibacter sp.]|uniref:hypothetical protein n=1 Tax=Luteibacter sp. TaxID=1886636 RepID=UPI0013860E88|nr:hypothetical protein [Luteibacter sp.]KAF1006026.1 MAG: hypothetical protein GAK28_02934 [Luteibacter sp.]